MKKTLNQRFIFTIVELNDEMEIFSLCFGVSRSFLSLFQSIILRPEKSWRQKKMLCCLRKQHDSESSIYSHGLEDVTRMNSNRNKGKISDKSIEMRMNELGDVVRDDGGVVVLYWISRLFKLKLDIFKVFKCTKVIIEELEEEWSSEWMCQGLNYLTTTNPLLIIRKQKYHSTCSSFECSSMDKKKT